MNIFDTWSEKIRQSKIAWGVATLIIIGVTVLASYLFYSQSIPIVELSNQAYEARFAGDNDEAYRIYKIISARADYNDYTSNYELGNILSEKGNYDQADHHYRRAALNGSAPASVYYQMADMYLHHLPDRADSFIEFMKTVAEYRKTDSNVRIVLAAFLSDIDRKPEAVEWFKKALDLDPSNEHVRNEIKLLEF